MKIREAEHKGRGRGGRARDNESIFLSVQFLSLSLFDFYLGCVCQFVIQYWLDKGPREIRNCCHQPTHFINTLVFALSKADRATHNKALYSIWLENHLAQHLAGNKQKKKEVRTRFHLRQLAQNTTAQAGERMIEATKQGIMA